MFNIFSISFIFYSFLLCLSASIPLSIIGSYVKIKKLNSIVGAISHSSISGIGLILFLNHRLDIDVNPIIGSLFSAVIFAIIIAILKNKNYSNEDSIISAIWGFGVALGLFFISKTPGYIDIESYLFGSNILLSSKNDFIIVFIFSILSLILSLIFYYRILFLCFDKDFLIAKGINTDLEYILFLILISINIIILVYFSGIILTIIMFSIPQNTASLFFVKLKDIMKISFLIILFSFISSFVLSYYLDLYFSICVVFELIIIYVLALILKMRF